MGDIPASNFIGGFKGGVGAATLPCRSCMIIRNELETIHLESDCILREKMSHETQVSQLESDNQTAAQKDSISTRYGVNCRCIFTILEYCDATKCFMHDLMHVSNEGILNSEISHLLKYLISHPIIKLDLDVVNYKILLRAGGGEQMEETEDVRIEQ